MAAAQQYDNELTGVLFPVKNKTNERGPDITGTATIGGTEYRVAGWKKTAKAGGAFYSLKFEIPQAGAGAGKGKGAANSAPSDDEPF